MSTKIDFSKMERLTPRADSWDKVCARLDAEKAKGKIVSIKSWYSAIPLAASFGAGTARFRWPQALYL